MYLVDLPGYGFARKSQSEKRKWVTYISEYVQSRDFSVLRRCYILVDSRREISANDIEMLDFLHDMRMPHQIILTKSDAASERELALCLESVFDEIMKPHRNACLPIIHAVSARKERGIAELKCAMAEILKQPF
jgi:GTP-binding protein